MHIEGSKDLALHLKTRPRRSVAWKYKVDLLGTTAMIPGVERRGRARQRVLEAKDLREGSDHGKVTACDLALRPRGQSVTSIELAGMVLLLGCLSVRELLCHLTDTRIPWFRFRQQS